MNKWYVSLLFRSSIFLVISAVTPSIANAMDAPRDTRGTVVALDAIKWEWANSAGAVRYQVDVNGVFTEYVSGNAYYSRNLTDGDYSFTVQAVNGDNIHSSPSVRSAVVSIGSAVQARSGASSSNLPAPNDARGTRVRDGEVKWEWSGVPGASGYEVTVNGNTYQSAEVFLYLGNLPVGEHTMTVKAVDGNGQKSAASQQVKTSTWVDVGGGSINSDQASQSSNASVDIPVDVRGTMVGDRQAKWEWQIVTGAARYQVYLDGVAVGDTPDNFYYTPDLADGDHSVTVAAIDTAGEQTAQSASATVNVNGSFADNSNSGVAPPPPADDNGLIDPASWNYPEVNQKPGYTLAFSDEFNTNTLNPARWNTQLRWDGSYNGERYEYRLINGEDQFYVNIYSEDQEHLDKVASVYNPFQFDGNRLAIRAAINPLKDSNSNNGYGPLDTISRQQPILSGAMSTYDKFAQKFGYFEARIKIPKHAGSFPAFWLHHQKRESEGTQKTEIDIMENLGHRGDYVYNSFHYFTGVSEGVSGTAHSVKPSPQGQIYTGIDYSQDYHVYAVEWEPGHLRFLIDGQQVSEVWNGASDHEELYIILNLAFGGNWYDMPTNAGGSGRSSDNRFPTQQDLNEWGNPALEIDYVRAYKRN